MGITQVLQGMGLGVAVSILMLIYHASSPYSTVLGRVAGTNVFHDIRIHSNLETIPGQLIFRFDSSLFFANATHFEETLRAKINAAKEPVRQVLIDAETINLIDSTATEMLLRLHNELKIKGITLAFSRVHDTVKDKMALAGVLDVVGDEYFYERLIDGADSFEK